MVYTMNKLISIIIPVYNVENYLKKCIESVIKQTYKNLEIILIDDGSTDNSGKICNEYLKKDSRIIVIHQENKGLSEARNAGLNIAKGEYIGFVDSDDYIANDMYEILIKLIVEYNADIAICNYTTNKGKKIIKTDKNNIHIFNKKQSTEKLIENNTIDNVVWNKLYKKDIFNTIKFIPNRMYEDIAIMYQLIDKAQKIVYTDAIKYFHNTNNEKSITHTITEKSINDYILSTNEKYNYIIKEYKHLEKELNVELIYSIRSQHNMAIKGKYKEFYMSDILLVEYKKMKKIIKQYGLVLILKKKSFKQKVSLVFLYMNRNITYYLLNFFYDIKSLIYKFF